MKYSHEQQDVISAWGQGQAVVAGAGCGKSTTLVEKCLELLRKKPEARFAAVSFTEKSANDLNAKFSALIPGFWLNSPHWVKTIHGLCSSIVQEFPEAAQFVGDEAIMDAAQATLLWEECLDWLWFEEIPEEVSASLEKLLDRESRHSLVQLLSRAIDLESLGYRDAILKSSNPDTLDLLRVTDYVRAKYERLKKRRGLLDFSDLEQGALRALSNPQVQKKYQERFDLVLVDEFQDTNIVQAQVIQKFVKKDFSNLCVVGDPKQSIYRFRDADLSVFEDFCDQLPLKQKLSQNFRCRPSLVTTINQFCEVAFEKLGLHYDPLQASREEQAGSGVFRVEIETPDDLARFIAGEKEKGVSLDQVVVLMRKIRGNEMWLEALKQNHVPMAVASGGFFWDDPRVREMVAFLKAYLNPLNRLSCAVFLKAPWMKIPIEELDQWILNSPLLFQRFLDSQHPVAQKLNAMSAENLTPAKLLHVLLWSDEAEEELGQAWLGLLHRVEELTLKSLSFYAVVEEISRRCGSNEREPEVPPPANQGQVRIMTLHGSKGLEFEHVILIDFGKKPRPQHAPLLFYDRDQGVFFASRNEEGGRNTKDTEEKEWRALEKKKNLEESLRLLYVAMTRARERLILATLPREFEEKDLAQAWESEDWRAWLEASSVRLPTLEFEKGRVKPPGGEEEKKPQHPTRQYAYRYQRARHSVTEWMALERCPRQYDWTYIRPRTPDTIDKFSEERQEMGKAIHRALELGDMSLISDYPDAPVKEIRAWAEKSPLMSGTRAWTEHPFELRFQDELLVGVMDRLQYSPSERFQLIDFKTTTKKYSEQELKDRYLHQIETYAWALKQIDPESEVEAYLVQIHPKGVDEVQFDVDLVRAEAWIEGKLKHSQKIIADEKNAEALPEEKKCRTCSFQKQCDRSTTA